MGKENNKGITLISLVITIIVLLILASIAINLTLGENGIFTKAKEAKIQTRAGTVEEHVALWKSENFMANHSNGSKVSAETMLDELKVKKLVYENEIYRDEEIIRIKREDGTIVKEISYAETEEINKEVQEKITSITLNNRTLELKEGNTETLTITTQPENLENAEVDWESDDTDVATVDANGKVTAIAEGEATITVSAKGDSRVKDQCTITVTKAIKATLEVGTYVSYNVPYTDMYAKIEYTGTTGWRYLGKDNNGNYLIVSTGIPGIVSYNYDTNKGNTVDGGGNSWWATKAEISTTTDTLYRTDKGYEGGVDERETSKYAAYGLRYKFEGIPFSYQASGTTVSTANTGIFRKVGTTTSGILPTTAFRATEISGKIVNVHNLTLAELNRATNSANGGNRAEDSTSSGFKDLTGIANGLFDMEDLSGYSRICVLLVSYTAFN